MYYCEKNRIRQLSSLFSIFMLILVILNNFSTIPVNCAKKSKSGITKKMKSRPKEHEKYAEKIHELSYSTPFRYHYSPWITRKLLLTLNITSTNTQYFSLDQLNSTTSENLEYDYKCDHPSIKRKIQDPRKIKPEIKPMIDIDDFKNSKDLTCHERVFLQNMATKLDKKNHWTNCTQLNKSSIEDICKSADEIAEILGKKEVDDKKAHEKLRNIFRNYSLKYCDKFALEDVISKINRERLLGQANYKGSCQAIISELVQLDALVNLFSCEFDEILSRIYCQGYSIKETCDECSNAYKQWLCSMSLPNYLEDMVIKPCLSICQRVERTCPYLHPEMKDQYGGEPIFICNDPDIPIAKNAKDEPYGKDRHCFQKCHFDANHTLTMKSLIRKNQLNVTEEFEHTENEEALIENPNFEICIPKENIIKRLNTINITKIYEDNESFDQRIKSENKTRNEKSNRQRHEFVSNWPIEENGYNNARMVNQIELEEEKLIQKTNNESAYKKVHLDDIYYLDDNISKLNEEKHQDNISMIDEDLNLKLNQKTITLDQDTKFNLNQHQDGFNHLFDDDENDNEDGDSDLDQIISTTTITSLNYAVNKQKKNLEKKQ